MSIITHTLDNGTSVFFMEDSRYDCICCGECCKNWKITVDTESCENLRNSPLCQKIQKENPHEEIFVHIPENNSWFIINIDNRCAFLKPDNLCRIHEEIGYHSKPFGCRHHPFIFSPIPEGIYVDTSMTCPGVRQNKGKQLRDHFPDIKILLSTNEIKIPETMNIRLADNIPLSWETYREIDRFTRTTAFDKEKNTLRELWRVFMILVTLAEDYRENPETDLSPEKIDSLLRNTIELPFDRDQIYLKMEAEFSFFLITMTESLENFQRAENFQSLLQGETIFSASFNKPISMPELQAYTKSHPAPWKNQYFIHYLEKLIWRKHPLASDTIINGFALINMLYPAFEWYFYASAYAGNAAQPEPEDALEALRIVELCTKHDSTEYVKGCAKSFAESFTKQVNICRKFATVQN